MSKNVFVVALDEYNLKELQTIRNADDYKFHALFEHHEIIGVDNYPVQEWLDKAEKRLRDFSGSVDGIIGHWDFPVMMMVSILCEKFDLPGPSLQSVVKCEDKYWSRVEQAKVIPECTPGFNKVDPFDDNALEKIELDYPFWLKPIKSFASKLGFKINNAKEFEESIQIIRGDINKIGKPFDTLLHGVDMPPEVAEVEGNFCIAEEMMSGKELAPEGYAFGGEVHVHGVIDMIREQESFARLEYPAALPEAVQQRAIEATKKFMTHIGYDNGCFNVEYFWNEERDKLWIIEVNPRISQSHSNMFEKVDGTSNHEVAVNVAVGQEPHFKHGQGKYECAAKFWVRRRKDGVVTRVPSEEDIREIQKQMPDTLIFPKVEEGMRLSELKDQDTYSYAFAVIHMGARDRQELLEKYNRCVEALDFRFS